MLDPNPIFRKEFAKPLEIEPRFRLEAHINSGSIICEKIKAAYLPEEKWHKCSKEVSKIFTVIKDRMREFDKSATENDFLKNLSQYSIEDLKDVYGPLPKDLPEKPLADENTATGSSVW